jgi:hypothetical protein
MARPAYVDAKLTSDFYLPANNGTGTIVPGLVDNLTNDYLVNPPRAIGIRLGFNF